MSEGTVFGSLCCIQGVWETVLEISLQKRHINVNTRRLLLTSAALAYMECYVEN